MNIEEVLAKITVAQHRLEIYKDLEAYLEDYLPNDTGNNPEVLEVSDPCISPKVSFESIEYVLSEVNKLRASEEEALKALNAMEADDGKPKPKRRTTKRKSPTKRKPPAKRK